tara:strand:- start:110 stop:280 length:171 start_codon:yes stop_codon:yes gene_type:complete
LQSFRNKGKGGAVAQLVEQRIENPCVGGSIPPHSTKKDESKGSSFLFYKDFIRLKI